MSILKRGLCAIALGVGLMAGPAKAASVDTVIEMFTSQGCSSCPPADALLEEMSGNDNVLALAFHVDYWDYLGWKDTLALASNTAYQKDYQRVFKSRSIYTPQAVVNGREHFVGSHRRNIEAEMVRNLSDANRPKAEVTMALDDGRIRVDAKAEAMGGQSALIQMVYFRPQSKVVVERGENAGRTLTYTNAVTKVDTLGMWDGQSKTLELPVSQIYANNAENCAVIVRLERPDGLPGAIIGAAVLKR